MYIHAHVDVVLDVVMLLYIQMYNTCMYMYVLFIVFNDVVHVVVHRWCYQLDICKI